ncbi:unnamed protein product [Parnassius apollo]|uniref:(apollo) hypothetical protein n=1 Tax=Parnassius apollo TaxID=110799 RepID=A0A8S3Y8C7_PARAO|nr:unnamed protein product [Parnassius apollo]
MELIDVIKRAQMPFMETYNSEFGVFRQGHIDYEPGTSTARLFRPETSVSGQYRHGYSTEYGPGNSSSRQYRHEYSTEYRPEISSSGQYRHGYSTQSNYGPEASSSESRRAYSTSVPDKQDNTGYTEVLSPSDTNVTDTSRNSELLELFQENSLA